MGWLIEGRRIGKLHPIDRVMFPVEYSPRAMTMPLPEWPEEPEGLLMTAYSNGYGFARFTLLPWVAAF